MFQKDAGETYISAVGCGTMVHALLEPGEENSGKLVSHVKKKAKEIAEKKKASLILADGPPGIGCPVIASLSGADLAVVVTEPTKSGIHDMERVILTARHFNVPVKAVINKADLNQENTEIIKEYLDKNEIELIGQVPYSKEFTHAVKRGKPVTEFAPDSKEAQCVRRIKDRIGE